VYFKIRKHFNRLLRKHFGRRRAHVRILRENLGEILDRIPSPVVLETGCVRKLDEGTESTLTIASTLRGRGRFLTFELRPEHIEVCRELCRDYNADIEYVEGDSVTNLQRMVESGELGRVDFAFLDSTNDGDHTWKEFQTLEQSFVPGSILVCDDVLWADKGRVLRPYLESSDEWRTRIYNEENGILVAHRI
jgi:predicted O-methyltransferase YrrM